MKTFYSILYCTIRPNVGERVSIGLFMGNEAGCKFQFSEEKFKVVRGLFTDSAYSMMKVSLKSLLNLSLECESDHLQTYKGANTLKEQYLGYLSRYANNLITYSEPANINVDLSSTVFNKLFEKFIYQLPVAAYSIPKPIEKARKRLTQSLAGHVNFNVDIDQSIVPGLVVPAKVFFIGKNEVQVTGEAKDFSGLKPHIIQQQINAHLFLIDRIKDTATGKNGRFFLIGDEPKREFAENHKLWQAVKSSSTLDLVPTDEIEIVERYMHEHGVTPLF